MSVDFFLESNHDIFAAEAAIRPETKEALRLHVSTCYGYDFPDTPVCEGHCSPMDVLWDLFVSTLRHLLIIGSRESGKTLIFAIAEHLLMRWNGDEIFHGAGIYPQAKRCFTYVEKAATDKSRPYFSNEVTKCIEDEVKLVGPSGREAKLEIKSATIEQLNGPHPRVVMLDEVELIDEKALNEAASLSGDTIISTQQGLIRLDAVKVGDVVDCLFEGCIARRPVVWAGQTGIGATLRLSLENGRTLTLTPTHEVLTPQGWRAAQALKLGDRIVSGLWSANMRGEVEFLSSRRYFSPRNENVPGGERLVLSPFAEADRGRRCTHGMAEDGGLSSRHLVGCAGAVLGHNVNESIRVVGIAAGPTIPVFDIGVQEAHNFVAEGVVVHNSMPHRDGKLPHLPPVLHYTSSLKKAYGPMVKFIEEKQQRGLDERRWCVFEVIEQCPTDRHQNGLGCLSCPLAPYCREEVRDAVVGDVRYKEGPGRAARARGWMLIDDVIAKMKTMDVGVFRSQWLSLEPQIEGLIYPAFNSNIHVIDYKWNPNLPVYGGMDWGYTNPHCILYAQQLYDEAVIIFAEDYKNLEIESKMAANCNATPWRQNIEWIMSDPSAPALIANFLEAGIRNVLGADNDVQAGIDDVRWALQSADLSMPPLLYVDRSCVNFIREIKVYHTPEPSKDLDRPEKPRKIDDHAMDALRYLIRRLFRARARMGEA